MWDFGAAAAENQGAPLLLDLGLLLILVYSAIQLLQPDNHHTFPSFRQTEQTNQPGEAASHRVIENETMTCLPNSLKFKKTRLVPS